MFYKIYTIRAMSSVVQFISVYMRDCFSYFFSALGEAEIPIMPQIIDRASS